MKLLVLGRGKTGSLVAEVARERGHDVRAIASAENRDGAALTREGLAGVDIVIDFTTPQAVVGNIEACVRARQAMVVGTTGWHEELDRVRRLVEEAGTGFLYAANFSVGVNVFFEVARAAGAALRRNYRGHIVEVHHAQKKDKPSGTAAVLQRILKETGGQEVEISSIREGDVVGQHLMALASDHDTLMLMHDARSRRGFAEGAVLAAEWLPGRSGFFQFSDLLRDAGR